MPPEIIVCCIVAGIFGCFIGSFLNVCIHRLPRNESIVQPPSRCYACGSGVAWYDNIPIASWLLLRGRCRWCGAPFSARYLAVEALVGLLTAATTAAALHFHWWSAPWLLACHLGPTAAAAALAAGLVLIWYLVVASVIDLEHMIIPDEMSMPLQMAMPLLAACAGTNLAMGWTPAGWLVEESLFSRALAPAAAGLHFAIAIAIGLGLVLAGIPVARRVYGAWIPADQRWSEADHSAFRLGAQWFAGALLPAIAAVFLLLAVQPSIVRPEGWALLALGLMQAVLGSLAGWLVPYAIGFLGTVAFRRNAMGYGDVKFLAPIGAFLGPVGVLYAFLGAAVAGAAVGVPLRLLARRIEIPFGPYLALGAMLALACGPWLHHLLLARFHW